MSQQPVLNPPSKKKKRQAPPPSQLSSPDEKTGEAIEELSRNMASGKGLKNGSTKPKEKLEKLTSRIQPELDLWLKQTPPEFKARYGRKIKQETLVQLALRMLKENPKALEVIDEQTRESA